MGDRRNASLTLHHHCQSLVDPGGGEKESRHAPPPSSHMQWPLRPHSSLKHVAHKPDATYVNTIKNIQKNARYSSGISAHHC